MKTFFYSLAILLFFTSLIFSQGRYNSNYGNQQYSQGNQEKPKKITPEMMAGILMYDYDEVIKKLKIKDEKTQLNVERAINRYNNKINEIKTFSIDVFSKIKYIIDEKTANSQNSNIDDFMEARYQIKDMLKPIQEKVDEQQKVLNESLAKDLSEKQNKKWLKYQLAKIKELRPSYNPNNSKEHPKKAGHNSMQNQ